MQFLSDIDRLSDASHQDGFNSHLDGAAREEHLLALTPSIIWPAQGLVPPVSF